MYVLIEFSFIISIITTMTYPNVLTLHVEKNITNVIWLVSYLKNLETYIALNPWRKAHHGLQCILRYIPLETTIAGYLNLTCNLNFMSIILIKTSSWLPVDIILMLSLIWNLTLLCGLNCYICLKVPLYGVWILRDSTISRLYHFVPIGHFETICFGYFETMPWTPRDFWSLRDFLHFGYFETVPWTLRDCFRNLFLKSKWYKAKLVNIKIIIYFI